MAKSEAAIKRETILETLAGQDIEALIRTGVATMIRIAEALEARSESVAPAVINVATAVEKVKEAKAAIEKAVETAATEEVKTEKTNTLRNDAKPEDIRTLMATYAKANGKAGRDMAIAELEKAAGVGRVADIPADKMNDVRAHFEALVA